MQGTPTMKARRMSCLTIASRSCSRAARGDLLRRLDRREAAVGAYRRALELATNEVERKFIETRIGELDTTRS